MAIFTDKKEIETLREGGRRLAKILKKLTEEIKPGQNALELNQLAEKLIRAGGDEPAFLNYKPDDASAHFPASLCVSVNNEVVHGLPLVTKIFREGDIVSLDLGLKHNGFFTDSAITVPVGKISKEAQKLINVTKEALEIGITATRAGGRVNDIGAAVQKFVEHYGFGIVRELAGHGVGRAIHEDPYVPNFARKGVSEKLFSGMVIAIEPMLNLGSGEVVFEKDNFTVRTKDGSLSAHFEHTILITPTGVEILTSSV